MITLAWYLLKVIICSGILCGYYYLALRNKIFHRWNRFYLLAAVVLSLMVPVMKINIFQNSVEDKGTVVRMLQTINTSDEIVIEYSRHNGLQLSSTTIISILYILITLIFLSIFFLALYKIYWLKKKYPGTKMKSISFISTDAKGTPFSFFNSIFWNNAIDIYSRQGQQIFNHEIAHVKEKHSYDKVFMNLLLIFFWMNPFFWLIRKELSMIHEFIADKEALEDSDINVLAEMILQTVYPGQQFSITNNFFHSPLKRRLTMFTKNKKPNVSYVSRLLVLPLTAIIFFAFTLKMTPVVSPGFYTGKTITVVIDAGHGGEDNGAVSADGLKEKDINLSIAKKIAELNSNDHIKILLSRDDDKLVPLKERVEFAKINHSDLFISIHLNAADDSSLNENGFSVLIDKNNTDKNKLLASALIQELKKSYTTDDFVGLRKNGIWVLDHNICPAALIECGYLTYPTDEAFITNNNNQEKIARNVLDGIEKYAQENFSGNFNLNKTPQDTVPAATLIQQLNNQKGSDILYVVDGKITNRDEALAINRKDIESINVLKDEIAIKQYGEKGKNGIIVITKKPKVISSSVTEKTIKPDPIYFVDGKEISKDDTKTVSANSIESITVLKGESAKNKYGKKGENGAVEINTKKSLPAKDNSPKELAQNQLQDTIPNKVFTKVENEAEFPGGRDAWSKYMSAAIMASIDSLTAKDYGTCLLKFIVNTDGEISNVEATTMKDTRLADIAVNAIRRGPRWIPATQNGNTVAAYRLQPVTLTNPEKK